MPRLHTGIVKKKNPLLHDCKLFETAHFYWYAFAVQIAVALSSFHIHCIESVWVFTCGLKWKVDILAVEAMQLDIQA